MELSLSPHTVPPRPLNINTYLIKLRVEGLFNDCRFVLGFLLNIWLEVPENSRRRETEPNGAKRKDEMLRCCENKNKQCCACVCVITLCSVTLIVNSFHREQKCSLAAALTPSFPEVRHIVQAGATLCAGVTSLTATASPSSRLADSLSSSLDIRSRA